VTSQAARERLEEREHVKPGTVDVAAFLHFLPAVFPHVSMATLNELGEVVGKLSDARGKLKVSGVGTSTTP
jgi:hypothetical protein